MTSSVGRDTQLEIPLNRQRYGVASAGMSDDDYSEPKLPTTHYSGPDGVLAEMTGEALSAIHSILSELVKQADLSDQRGKSHHRDLNTIIQNAVWMDRHLGP
jgi:hypothetical protein